MTVPRLTSSGNTYVRFAVCIMMLLAPLWAMVGSVNAATPAPLAAYSFDRVSGTPSAPVFFDESGNGNDCMGSDQHITLQVGHTNSAINDASSSQYATCTNQNLQPTGALTVMAWVQNTNGGGYQSAIVNMPNSASLDDWGLYAGDWTEGFSGGLTTTGGSAWLPSDVPQNDSLWHYLVLTYDGTTAKFYVDGALTNSQALTGSITYGSTFPLQLYEDEEGMGHFQVSIDDLRIYNTALTQSQVQTLMNTPVQNSTGHTYSRSMTMNDSSPGASNVTYSTSFTADKTYGVQSIVVDFCSNSPLIGGACTVPPGFSLGTPTVSNFQIGGTPVNGWTASSANGATLVYGGGGGTNVGPGTVITFDITGVVNPSTTGSFYARILTYSFASPTYSATDTDNFKESGAVALSTVNGVNFTFQVPESLTFCVYKSSCGDSPAVALGHGTSQRLDSTAVDVDSVKFAVSTNAQSGVAVNAKGDTLKSGSYQIPAIDGGSGAANKSMSPGAAAFGMDIPSSDASYIVPACLQGDGTATGYYCFYLAGIKSSYGSGIISGTGPLNNAIATLAFAATVSPTTPAGTYTATISLIATATF